MIFSFVRCARIVVISAWLATANVCVSEACARVHTNNVIDLEYRANGLRGQLDGAGADKQWLQHVFLGDV